LAKRKRTYNLRLIKATWPYSVQEIAALFGVHKNAVLIWLKEGLQADRDKRPFLIRGDELIRFLFARQKGRKRRCAPTEFYCFKCRAPREAYLGIADIVIESASRLRIKALCATCSTPINKVQSTKTFERFKKLFNVQQLEGLHLIECIEASVNSDMEISA
jgi:hypothetical protein